MDAIVAAIRRSGLLKQDVDSYVLRFAMVVIFAFFSYQKWFEYEAERLVPFISHGPLIWWLYPLLGVRGASVFLGVAETTIGLLLFAGFWNRVAGALGAIGSAGSFICTVTIIPFMPDGWAKTAGGFPAMDGNVPFLMKDVVLLAVSLCLLREDVERLVGTIGARNTALSP